MNRIGVAIVDDQNIFRQMLGIAVTATKDLSLLGTYQNGNELMEALPLLDVYPDVIIVDIDMPGMNGFEINDRIQKIYPGIKTIMLSQHTDADIISRLINSGASAYLDKGCKQEELFLAVHTVVKTGYYINAATIRAISKSHKINRPAISVSDQLSVRELEVLKLICKQYTNTEIAEQLFISVKTVDFHRANLLKKTNSRNVVGLVYYAINNNFSD